MLKTKNISDSSSVSKTLTPGNHTVKINSVALEEFKFKPGSYHLVLLVEGPELDAPFEGFLFDKDNPEGGRYKGQIGRVRTNEFAYLDGETKTGRKVYRDEEIMKAIRNVCITTGDLAWFDAQDEKHATIESLVEAFNTDAPFKDKWIDICIAGKEYLNKGGYINHELFLPKYVKGQVSMELSGADSGKLTEYDPNIHLKKAEPKAVSQFGEDEGSGNPPAPASNDFEL